MSLLAVCTCGDATHTQQRLLACTHCGELRCPRYCVSVCACGVTTVYAVAGACRTRSCPIIAQTACRTCPLRRSSWVATSNRRWSRCIVFSDACPAPLLQVHEPVLPMPCVRVHCQCSHRGRREGALSRVPRLPLDIAGEWSGSGDHGVFWYANDTQTHPTTTTTTTNI